MVSSMTRKVNRVAGAVIPGDNGCQPQTRRGEELPFTLTLGRERPTPATGTVGDCSLRQIINRCPTPIPSSSQDGVFTARNTGPTEQLALCLLRFQAPGGQVNSYLPASSLGQFLAVSRVLG